jgi:hypothetical protein
VLQHFVDRWVETNYAGGPLSQMLTELGAALNCNLGQHPNQAGLERFQELYELLPFLPGESQLHVLVIVRDDCVQRLETAVMIEAALLMAPQTCERRGAVHVSW